MRNDRDLRGAGCNAGESKWERKTKRASGGEERTQDDDPDLLYCVGKEQPPVETLSTYRELSSFWQSRGRSERASEQARARAFSFSFPFYLFSLRSLSSFSFIRLPEKSRRGIAALAVLLFGGREGKRCGGGSRRGTSALNKGDLRDGAECPRARGEAAPCTCPPCGSFEC